MNLVLDNHIITHHTLTSPELLDRAGCVAAVPRYADNLPVLRGEVARTPPPPPPAHRRGSGGQRGRDDRGFPTIGELSPEALVYSRSGVRSVGAVVDRVSGL